MGWNSRGAVCLLVLFFGSLAVAGPLPRQWTDATGKYQLEAAFVEYDGQAVTLKREDGTTLVVPLERLSVADQAYVKSVTPAPEPQKYLQIILGKVVGVTDGDTITVLDDDKQQHRIRLEGIDAPEDNQAFGTQAKKALSDKIFQKDVNVEVIGKDRYGRLLADVRFKGRWINKEMVADGFAWHYKEYSDSKALAEAEDKARAFSLGLWTDKEPVAPWIFRRVQPDPPPKPQPEVSPEEKKEITVYITKTGSKYHRVGCRYLKKSSIPISLDQAKKGYSPCSVCNPP